MARFPPFWWQDSRGFWKIPWDLGSCQLQKGLGKERLPWKTALVFASPPFLNAEGCNWFNYNDVSIHSLRYDVQVFFPRFSMSKNKLPGTTPRGEDFPFKRLKISRLSTKALRCARRHLRRCLSSTTQKGFQDSPSDFSGQFVTTSAEVTPNGGLVRESHSKSP